MSWLGEVGKLKTPSENTYDDLLEAAFGNPTGETVFENGGSNNSSEIEGIYINVSPSQFGWPDARSLRRLSLACPYRGL